MKNKLKWYSILLIGLVVLLASSVVGCGPSAPPVITDFSVTPIEINAGESASLFWNVTEATSISIDHNIGEVSAVGTQTVSPTTTTAYTLTAINDAGLVTKSVVIAVREVSPLPSSTIAFSPSSFSFSADEGGANPASKTLTISNSGSGTLDWSVSDDANWLSLSPSSGSSTGETDEVTISVDINSLNAGNYAAIITISASEASNTPQTLPVKLAITSQPVIDALDTDALLEIGYSHPEKEVTVEGTIVGSYYCQSCNGQPTFLNFHDPYEGYFTALIWGDDRYKFPSNPESYYLNKRVRVKGTIEIYKGSPEIILRDQSQIWIVG